MIDESKIELILRPLIQVDTTNPPGRNYRKIVEIIEHQLLPTGCSIKKVKTPKARIKGLSKVVEGVDGERVNLIAHMRKGKGKTLLLNAHVDVVPAGSGWRYPPFTLVKSGRRLYGRGVADDKGPLAVLILVFNELAKNSDWHGSLILTATVDEEIGGYTGLSYLLDQGLVTGDYCIVGDGSIESITHASNGCLRFRVLFRGKAVHSSMYWRGVNTIEKAAKLIERLEKYNKHLFTRKSKIQANPRSGVDWLTPCMTVGVIKGGVKVNIVPDRCVLEIDRRVIPEENKAEAIQEFIEILKELKKEDENFNYEIQVGGFHNAFVTPKSHKLIKTFQHVYEKNKNEPARIFGSLGCLDASYVVEHNIPTVNFGVRRIESRVHGIDEFAYIDDMRDFGIITKETILKLLK